MGDDAREHDAPLLQKAFKPVRILPHRPRGGDPVAPPEPGEIGRRHAEAPRKVVDLRIKTFFAAQIPVQKHEVFSLSLLQKGDIQSSFFMTRASSPSL